jgi:hypothetical protein
MGAADREMELPVVVQWLLPNPDAPPFALINNVWRLSTLAKESEPSKWAWSDSHPNLDVHQIMDLKLFSDDFYHSLFTQANTKFKNGARSIDMYDGVRLPFYFITFARKMLKAIQASKDWKRAFKFNNNQKTASGHLPRCILYTSAAEELMKKIPFDAKITRDLAAGKFSVVMSDASIGSTTMDAIVEVLNARLSEDESGSRRAFVCSSSFWNLFRKPTAREDLHDKRDKSMSQVCSHSIPFWLTLIHVTDPEIGCSHARFRDRLRGHTHLRDRDESLDNLHHRHSPSAHSVWGFASAQTQEERPGHSPLSAHVRA